LVVNRHTLRAVHALNAAYEVALHLAGTHDTHDLLGVKRSDQDGLTDLDMLAVLDEKRCTLQHRVDHLFVTVVRREDDLLGLVGLVDRDATIGLGDRRRTLGRTSLEELLHTGQTLGDVIRRCRTTGVERTHRQLSTGLTDRLCGDDADGLTDVYELTGCKRAAVALRADTDSRVAREDGADLDGLDAERDELVDENVTDVFTGSGNNLALAVDDIRRQGTSEHRVLDVRIAHQFALRVRRGDRELEALRRAAVHLADDDVLRDIHQTTGQVTRVGGTQSGVSQTLTGTVRRDEV